MGVDISGMNIGITAHTEEFVRDVNTAGAALNNFAKGAKDIPTVEWPFKPVGEEAKQADAQFKKLGASGKSLAGMTPVFDPISLGLKVIGKAADIAKAAFDAVVGSVSSAMEEFGRLDDVASRLQIPVDDLIAFRFAAEEGGVGADVLDKSLDRMTRSLGEVAAGGGKATSEALSRIGLDAKELAAQSPAQSFEQIADAISQIKSPTEQAAAAYAVFGRQGQELLPMLMKGSGELDRARAEMDRLNMSLSSADAASVAKAGDEIAKIGMAIKGMAMQFTAGLAPALEQAGISLTDVFSGKADIMRELGERVGEIILEFLEFAPTLKVAVDGALAFAGALAEVVAVAAKVITAMTDLGNWIKRFYDDVQPPTIEPPKVPEVKAPEIDYSAEAERLKLEEEARKAAEEAAKAEQKRIDDLMKKGEQLTKGLRLPDEIFRDSLSEAKSLLDANAIGIDTYSRAIEEARSKFVDAAMKENEALRDSLNVDLGIANRGTQAGFGAARAGDKALDDMRKKLDEQKAIQQAIADATEQVAQNTKGMPRIQPLKL